MVVSFFGVSFTPQAAQEPARSKGRSVLRPGDAHSWLDSSLDLRQGLEVLEVEIESLFPDTMPAWHVAMQPG